MTLEQLPNFWRDTPPAAKWALVAAGFLVIVALAPFAVITIMVSVGEHISPLKVIFGPGPGMPLIVWLYTTVPPAVVQGAAAFAIRHQSSGVRVAGVVGVLVVLTAALTWLGAMAYAAVQWLVTGTMSGDYYDVLGIVFFGVPVLVAIAVLDLRAALLGIRDHPRGHELPITG